MTVEFVVSRFLLALLASDLLLHLLDLNSENELFPVQLVNR